MSTIRLSQAPQARAFGSRTRNWLFGAVSAIAIAIGMPANAQTVTTSNISVPLSDSGISITLGSTTESNIIAGQIVLTATDSAMPAAGSFSIYAWCIDLYHNINTGSNTYTFTIGGSPATNGNGVVISSAVAKQLATLAAYGNSLLAGGGGNATISSAIQLAIWQTEYSTANGGPGLTFTDTGSDSSALTADVTAYESYAASHTLSAATLVPLSGQQQLITNTVSPAPEPASVAMFAIGALGLAFAHRRTFARRGAVLVR